MRSDLGKGHQARKRFAEIASMAPAKENDYKGGAAAAYDLQE
jgi:hypothetical protein